MTFSERCYRWNIWYDGLPPEWRFQFVLWPLIVLGAINVLLTVSARFPFGLLLLLGILLVAAVRVPFLLRPAALAGGLPPGEAGQPGLQIGGADWLIDLNRRYDAMPELQRFWVLPAVLLIAGAINMLLTIGSGFPFGLIFLLALLAMVAMRVLYTAGWLRASTPASEAVSMTPQTAAIGHASPTLAEPVANAPAAVAVPQVPETSVRETAPPAGAPHGSAAPPAAEGQATEAPAQPALGSSSGD